MTTSAASVARAGGGPAGTTLEALPARARGLQLLGALAGSGYREAPTLVRRGDGQLIKLTPLLYELIDAIDGRRGHAELADELGRRVGKQVTADDVRHLIELKLRPIGLLQQADGLQPKLERSNPLLALRPRVVISKPELTRSLTSPFAWLFRPIVVIPMLLAFAAISLWLLVEKGLSSALHQAFYEPGLILVLWGLVVLSAAFHEIGHAAACRYGGARPGVMGGGLYLVWPAFYTEVSDSYRLDRRGRLRVDLGGLYFSAVFAVGTAGLWRLTGADALLLVIAVQLLQMVRQLAPFIRADGYHLVADLVGVPDLFAHIKPTLLGLLPTRWGRPEHKRLKPWARAVVAGWVLITVPALVVVLGVIILAFPRLAATAWDSAGLRWAETTTYWNAADVAGVAMSLISIVLVALPVLSITYLVSYLGRRIGLRAWRETAGSPPARAAALLGVAVLVAALAWAWWPGENYRPVDARERGPMPTIMSPDAASVLPAVERASAATASPAGGAPVTGAPRSLSERAGGGSPREPAGPPEPHGDPYKAPDWRERFDPRPDPAERATTAAPSEPATAPEPTQAESADPAEWPFPFDPPEPAKPGDNRAMAVNTADGSRRWDFATSLLVLQDGDPVRHANEAHAYARCASCLTGAVAFQVILIVGQVEEIAPLNAAVAANYECVACDTSAFAYQIVATVADAPDPEVQSRLGSALQQVRGLEAHSSSLSPSELYLALEQAEQDVLQALEGIVAIDRESATAAPQAEGEADYVDETQQLEVAGAAN
jgi:putative peptide zinc metalloprotease protein